MQRNNSWVICVIQFMRTPTKHVTSVHSQSKYRWQQRASLVLEVRFGKFLHRLISFDRRRICAVPRSVQRKWRRPWQVASDTSPGRLLYGPLTLEYCGKRSAGINWGRFVVENATIRLGKIVFFSSEYAIRQTGLDRGSRSDRPRYRPS